MKKLKNNRGETLIESMMAMVLILLAVSIFGGYLLTAGEIVKKEEQQGLTVWTDDALSETSEAVLKVSARRGREPYRELEKIPVILYYGEYVAAYEMQQE